MKKLALFLILTFPIFTGMKVVYKNTTGEIISIGSYVDYKTKDGESVIDVPEANPDQRTTHIVKDGTFREKIKAERDAEKDQKDEEKQNRKDRKSAVLTKLGLTNGDIQGLLELVKDGNTD